MPSLGSALGWYTTDKPQKRETTAGIAPDSTQPQALFSLHSEAIIESVPLSAPQTKEVSPENLTQATVESVSQTVKRSGFDDEYHEIKITDQETALTDKLIYTEERTISGPFPQDNEEERTFASSAKQEEDDAGVGLPDDSLFPSFDKNGEEIPATDMQEEDAADRYFDQSAVDEMASRGTRQHDEDEDYIEAQEEMPDEVDSEQATGTVVDTAFYKGELLLHDVQKSTEEVGSYQIASEDLEPQEEYREAEDDISEESKQSDTAEREPGVQLTTGVEVPQSDTSVCFVTEQVTTVEVIEAEATFDQDILDIHAEKKIEDETEDQAESEAEEEPIKRDSQCAELAFDHEQVDAGQKQEVAGSEELQTEEQYESEYFTEASEEMPVKAAEEMLAEDRQMYSVQETVCPVEQQETTKDEEGKLFEDTMPTGSVESIEKEDEEILMGLKAPGDTSAEQLQYGAEELETDQTESLQFDIRAKTTVEAGEDFDEEWEILEKTDLTEEEKIAAMDEALMHSMPLQDEQSNAEAQEEARDQETAQYLMTTDHFAPQVEFEYEQTAALDTGIISGEIQEKPESATEAKQTMLGEREVLHEDEQHAREEEMSESEEETPLEAPLMHAQESVKGDICQEQVTDDLQETQNDDLFRDTKDDTLIDFSQSEDLTKKQVHEDTDGIQSYQETDVKQLIEETWKASTEDDDEELQPHISPLQEAETEAFADTPYTKAVQEEADLVEGEGLVSEDFTEQMFHRQEIYPQQEHYSDSSETYQEIVDLSVKKQHLNDEEIPQTEVQQTEPAPLEEPGTVSLTVEETDDLLSGQADLLAKEQTENLESELAEEISFDRNVSDETRSTMKQEYSEMFEEKSDQATHFISGYHQQESHTVVFESHATNVFGAEGFTQETDYMNTSPVMSQSTESTEAEMASSGEGLFADQSQQDRIVTTVHVATKAEQSQEAEHSDLFEAHAAEGDVNEQYSDGSDEELKPLKMTATDIPTEQPTSDFVQDTTDQTETTQLEAQESRPSPSFGSSTDEQVYRSPSEEQIEEQLFQSSLQEEIVEEERAGFLLPEQRSDIFEEETEIEQVAVCGILAEIQDMEQHAAQEESEEEAEDGLEQYEGETCEEQTGASEQRFETQYGYQERHTASPDKSAPEHDREEKLVTEKESIETHQMTDVGHSAEPDSFIDRTESFSLEEREVSVQHKVLTETRGDEAEEEISSNLYVDRAESFLEEPMETTDLNEEEKKQRDVNICEELYTDRVESFLEETAETTDIVKEDEEDQGEEFSADLYVDRTERFMEEPVETVTESTNLEPDGSVPHVTGTDGATEELDDQDVGEPQSSAQKDTSRQDPSFQEFADEYHLSQENDLPEGTVSRRFESESTSRNKTWATSEYTIRESEFEPENGMTVYEQKFEQRMSEQTFKQTTEERHDEDMSDRPMSPSEYTLITPRGEEPGVQVLHVHPEEDIVEEEEEGEEMDKANFPLDEQGSEQPPSPTEYTLVSSQEQESLTEVLGLQTGTSTASEERTPQEPGEEAHIQCPESSDNNAASKISFDQYLAKEYDPKDKLASQIETSAPQTSPSPKTEDMVRTSSYENLYQNMAVLPEPPLQPVCAEDLDIGDRFDSRHTEPHLKGLGRTCSFEGLYAVDNTLEATAFTQEGGEILGAEAAPQAPYQAGRDDDRPSSASSDAARLEDMEDGAGGPEDRSIRTDEEESGDDNNDDIGAPGDEDYAYTHSVVMKKEVHQRTTVRPDGQEDTVITEDSQVHQDSETPGELRHSMEQIIQHFMQDSPHMPRVQGQDDEEPDEGTEV